MLSVADAQALILAQARPLPPVEAPLAGALGCVLAGDVVSDLDMPPHDKALMDGYAVRSADLAAGEARLCVVETVTAGRVPTLAVGPGQATRIMTGAVMPTGADAVVMVERSRALDDGRVELRDRPPRSGANVLPRGREMRRGETVVTRGTLLGPAHLGVLATVGRATVGVHPRPRIAVLSTGDEVVEAAVTPGPGQIRNGNGPLLTAQSLRAGAAPRYLGIARDALDSLRPLVEDGLRDDVLVLSGGVSAGALDLVPAALREAGVEPQFHKIAMKPGKPAFFGTRGRQLVFGLPGNPVSAFVCFELFVRPALRALAGRPTLAPLVQATLTEDYAYATDRPTYHPARLGLGPDGWRVRAAAWFGSADLRGLSAANALLVLPVGDLIHRAGTRFSVLGTEDDVPPPLS